jgi:hypothetical protein
MQPLRAIVLDNDEATGSYLLLFDIWDTLIKTQLGRHITFRQVVEFFFDRWATYSFFRPGLFTFLRTCVQLRRDGKIDAILMYTHQNAEFTWAGWSIPAFLAILMHTIVARETQIQTPLFDYVLSLPPPAFQKNVDGWIVKDFDRILHLYPWRPRDIRQIIFIDDNATPQRIEADTIPPEGKAWSAWYKVSPYRVGGRSETYMHAIYSLVAHYDIVLHPNDTKIIAAIAAAVASAEAVAPPPTYDPDDRTFLDLEMYVRERFRNDPPQSI